MYILILVLIEYDDSKREMKHLSESEYLLFNQILLSLDKLDINIYKSQKIEEIIIFWAVQS